MSDPSIKRQPREIALARETPFALAGALVRPAALEADSPLATGNVGLDANDDVIFSQALDLDVDLGMIELRRRS
jgi:hypothetical protein